MDSSDNSAFGRALIKETERRLFDESAPRIRQCLAGLTDDEIWTRPNESTVSVGNLVLHLCGNVRQWICAGLAGFEDDRDRDSEFAERGPIPREELIAKLGEMERTAREALASVDPATLLEPREVQAFEESGLSILVHVVEHFSYHVGQIGYFVKTTKNRDLKYYAGFDLNAKGR